jgi:hypothetical protein
MRELTELGIGFVSLTEALDLTTSTGRAMAGMLAVFAEFEREVLRERVGAGIVSLDKCGVGSDRLQRARHNPLRLAPPRCREVVFLRAPTPLVKGGSAQTTIPALSPTRVEPHHSPASGTGRTPPGRVPG